MADPTGLYPMVAPTLFSVLLMGISVGLTSCAATCLPFLGTWTLGRGHGGWSALADTGMFLTGKIIAYTLLGAGAGFLGIWITDTLTDGLGHIAIGLSGILAGIWLIMPKKTASQCPPNNKGGSLPPLLLGFSMSLVPCAPLTSLLALSAMTGEVMQGAEYGALFGMGTSLTPLLFIMPLVGVMGKNITFERPWLGRWLAILAGITLVILGLYRLNLGV
ncbi:MAG: sulfite exporter TauE/SafE family protein [Magnetococcales bacterium]|nr:sulfite exporter TauE/SafE family protein [Magnetococcales bacterium]